MNKYKPTKIYRCILSSCGLYRYSWSSTWDNSLGNCVFIGLNPATADAQQTDPITRRCMQYAKDWGYGTLTMLNLFAFRATSPKQMIKEIYPIGLKNDWWLTYECEIAHCIVAAWGACGAHQGRSTAVRRLLKDYPLYYLALTKSGEPKHPLYLKRNLIPYRLKEEIF